MNIPKLASDNHQFVMILFVLMTFLGVNAFFTMPRTEDPPITVPGATVVAVLPGASPADLEELVANPLEEALNELEEVDGIETTIQEGVVSVSVEFAFKTDAEDKFGEVVQKVNTLRNELPDEIYSISTHKWNTTDVNILQLAFVSDSAEYSILEDYAEQLKKEIEQVSGVKSVNLYGCPNQEVRVSLDVPKMSMMNISLDQVSNAIVSNNLNIPGGSIRAGNISFTVKTSGFYESLDEIRNTVVGSYQGSIIRLEHIAAVDFSYEDESWITRFNGHRAVFLTVMQKEGLNIFSISAKIQQILDKTSEDLADDVALYTVFDQSVGVDDRIKGFLSNLLQGILIVGIIIFISLGFRAAFLVILAVPLSIVIGLGMVDIAGFGMQQVTIAALVVALGMLVDNSIVITENIERFIRKGYTPREASVRATNQLFFAVASATLTTQLAFIPIMMMPDETGDFIKGLPVTVILTLFASLLIALLLTPYLGGVFFKPSVKGDRKLPVQQFLYKVADGAYARLLRRSLEKPWETIVIAFVLFGASLLLVSVIGISFFPKAEKAQFMVQITVPDQSDIHFTDQAARKVESILDTIPLVKNYATNVGHGNPRIYYNLMSRQTQKNFAEIFVELEFYRLKEFDELISDLRRTFNQLTIAKVEIKELEQGSPIEAPVVIEITGEDNSRLAQIARQIEDALRHVQGVINIDNQVNRISTDLKIEINKNKAGMYGVPVAEIDRSIRAFMSGVAVSTYHDPQGEEFDIVLRAEQGDSFAVEDIYGIYVQSLQGSFIPLSQLVDITFESSNGILMHENLKRSATLTADIQKGYYLDEVIEEIKPWLDSYSWPDGYRYAFRGEVESRSESFGGMFRALIVAAILIFALLVLQFRSVMQPLIIFSAVPLAITGAVVALFVTGNSFSFTAFVGAISLVGIVVNNSIILVDYTNQLIKDGATVHEALIEAGKTRLTPIILTAVTTIGGLLPLTIAGGTLWAPMGWTIIGGLLFSTVLTLVVVPALYRLLRKSTGQ